VRRPVGERRLLRAEQAQYGKNGYEIAQVSHALIIPPGRANP
jgi:hypothetical protein